MDDLEAQQVNLAEAFRQLAFDTATQTGGFVGQLTFKSDQPAERNRQRHLPQYLKLYVPLHCLLRSARQEADETRSIVRLRFILMRGTDWQ